MEIRTAIAACRKCNVCGMIKGLPQFAEDPTRALGRAYICKQCKQEQNRLRRKRHKLYPPKRPTRQPIPTPMMTNDVFKVYYENADLREFIRKYAIRHSKRDRDFQEDLKQIAWMNIAMCESGKTIEYYKSVAKRAIYNEYRKRYEKREYNLTDLETMSRIEYEMWQHGTRIG